MNALFMVSNSTLMSDKYPAAQPGQGRSTGKAFSETALEASGTLAAKTEGAAQSKCLQDQIRAEHVFQRALHSGP